MDSVIDIMSEADERYERARAVALDALADAAPGGAPAWRREELYDFRAS